MLQVRLNRLTGYRRSLGGRQRRPIIRSTGTLRIRQVDGLNLSTVIATSPLRPVAIVTRTDFHKISRAAGPKGQVGNAGASWQPCVVRVSNCGCAAPTSAGSGFACGPTLAVAGRSAHVRLVLVPLGAQLIRTGEAKNSGFTSRWTSYLHTDRQTAARETTRHGDCGQAE